MGGKRITVTRSSADEFRVEVNEGGLVSSYQVTVPDGYMDGVGLAGAEPAAVIEESFRFLLEREPASSILRKFSLDVIARYFPDYPDELRARIKG